MTRAGWAQPVAVAAGAALLVGLLAGLITDIGPWYLALRQPPWKPPDWAFGPIWTSIFTLAAAAGVLGWRRLPTRSLRLRLLGLFVLNGCLNVVWSWLFFRLQRPDWAVVEVPFLWLSVLALMRVLRQGRTGAAWLLAPYLAWVGIASVLNWEIVQLNGPFGAR